MSFRGGKFGLEVKQRRWRKKLFIHQLQGEPTANQLLPYFFLLQWIIFYVKRPHHFWCLKWSWLSKVVLTESRRVVLSGLPFSEVALFKFKDQNWQRIILFIDILRVKTSLIILDLSIVRSTSMCTSQWRVVLMLESLLHLFTLTMDSSSWSHLFRWNLFDWTSSMLKVKWVFTVQSFFFRSEAFLHKTCFVQ